MVLFSAFYLLRRRMGGDSPHVNFSSGTTLDRLIDFANARSKAVWRWHVSDVLIVTSCILRRHRIGRRRPAMSQQRAYIWTYGLPIYHIHWLHNCSENEKYRLHNNSWQLFSFMKFKRQTCTQIVKSTGKFTDHSLWARKSCMRGPGLCPSTNYEISNFVS
jgi:hypothetical protein